MEEERRRLREEQEAEDRERGNDAGAQAALDSVVPLEFNPTTDEAAIPATPPSPVTP
jgi:hypothetical protein